MQKGWRNLLEIRAQKRMLAKTSLDGGLRPATLARCKPRCTWVPISSSSQHDSGREMPDVWIHMYDLGLKCCFKETTQVCLKLYQLFPPSSPSTPNQWLHFNHVWKRLQRSESLKPTENKRTWQIWKRSILNGSETACSPLATEEVIDELPFTCRSWWFEGLDKFINLITGNVPQKQFKYKLPRQNLWETFWSDLTKNKNYKKNRLNKSRNQHLK